MVRKRKTDTTLLDIYEAAGAKVNDERTMATINGQLQPFEIRLRVWPSAIQTGLYEPEKITFCVLLDDDYISEGAILRQFSYSETLELPVNQIDIIKEKE